MILIAVAILFYLNRVEINDIVGKDFHILNEPYGRTEYFALLAKLSRELGIKA